MLLNYFCPFSLGVDRAPQLKACVGQRLLTSMRRLILQTIIAVALFAGGIALGAAWHARRGRTKPPTSPSAAAQRPDEKPWPLTKQVVARSLQSHSFRTDKLRLNANDDVVWRWLKESVANYPQNWVKLNINETESYGVVIYPPKTLEPMELAHCNKQLSESGLPLVSQGKRYLPIQINVGNIICPDWYGLVDPDEARLVFFEGRSA